MKLSTVHIAGVTSLSAGGQRRFFFPGTADHQKKPLVEGLFFARFSAHSVGMPTAFRPESALKAEG
jgi:hypothetical protein